MIEVQARLRFNTHCLGARQCGRITRFLKDPQSRVMLLPSAWEQVMVFAATVMNRHQAIVKDIEWDPVVDGAINKYKRYYEPSKFQLHEAFIPGDQIGVNAVLPDGLPIEDFSQLLSVAGQYRGISPYRQTKGTFEVLDVSRRKRTLSSETAVEVEPQLEN
jgi:hypothetical protein